VGVCAPIAKGVDTCLASKTGGPRHGVGWDSDMVLVERNTLAGFLEVDIRKNYALLQHEHTLDQACESRGTFEMSDLRVNSALVSSSQVLTALTLALTDPTMSSSVRPAFLKDLATAASSMGSPTAVPVPWRNR
jgi:hypothetical protein